MGTPVGLRLTPQDLHFGIEGLENWAGRWVRFRARLRPDGSGPVWPRLHFDFGGGFSQLRALTLPECSRRSPEIDYVLFVPKRLRAARLDPALHNPDFAPGEASVTPLSKYSASLRMLAAVATADGPGTALPYAFSEFLSLFHEPKETARRGALVDRYREIRRQRGGS